MTDLKWLAPMAGPPCSIHFNPKTQRVDTMFNRKLKARIAELEQRINKANEALFRSVCEEKRLQVKLKEANSELKEWRQCYAPLAVIPIKAKRLVGIKFNALFNGLYQPTNFKSGPGACGKDVKWFDVREGDRHLTIIQHHTDGSHKEFIYRLSDIDGRIQKDYEDVTLQGKDAEAERTTIKIDRIARFV